MRFRGQINQLFKYYKSNRLQKIEIVGPRSVVKTLKKGVAQRSITRRFYSLLSNKISGNYSPKFFLCKFSISCITLVFSSSQTG